VAARPAEFPGVGRVPSVRISMRSVWGGAVDSVIFSMATLAPATGFALSGPASGGPE
jgi:hypothetical protein